MRERKRWQRILCLLFTLALLSGCGGKGAPAPAADPRDQALAAAAGAPDDGFRSWYEVFVWSFADSDGDGIGDLRGVTEQLPYIASLGCRGIWLMPVMPSPSYHKYDVTDYCDIDPQYGTLEDFRALAEAAHGLGLKLILDLPVNHSSDRHPWFLAAAADPDSPYRAYYNWSDTPLPGYTELGGSWYESRFVSSMPDLNLDNPAVRQEIETILRFWLKEQGADGFRLDAVTSYYTGDLGRNQAFLNDLADMAHGIDPDCFLVGEAWEGLSQLARYAETRVDSFFCFPMSQAEGYVARCLSPANRRPGKSFGEYCLTLEQELPGESIPALFTENHDTGRTVGFTGRTDPAKTKMAGGLLCLLRGSVFIYYGQEIGMAGSGEDPNKRIAMLWGDREPTVPPPGATTLEYPYPSAAEQERDENSILNYYRAALTIRNTYPAIARGESRLLPCEEERTCLLERRWGEERLLLAVNPSAQDVTLHLSGEAGDYGTVGAFLCADASQTVVLRQGSLTLPAYSYAVLTP